MTTYLLDTNAAIAVLNRDPAILPFLVPTNNLLLSSISLGELYYGAEKSKRNAENIQRIEAFIAQRTILSCDGSTARVYGHIRQQLRAKGRPIPENDYWIAAIVLQNSLTLLTRDAHFNEVDGLAAAGW
jgi:tRNA(fMet)-specific endonuclease VapC